MTVNVAVPYGGRREIADAVRSMLLERSARGESVEALLLEAEAELAKAEGFVSSRRRALWDPDSIELLRNKDNPTFYDYGYLREADTLCFWKRERAQVRNLLLGEGLFIPACVL